jgi:hypothetical protein
MMSGSAACSARQMYGFAAGSAARQLRGNGGDKLVRAGEVAAAARNEEAGAEDTPVDLPVPAMPSSQNTRCVPALAGAAAAYAMMVSSSATRVPWWHSALSWHA